MLRKILLISAVTIGIFICLGIVGCFILSEPMPNVTPSKAADALAEKMLEAVNKPAWDSTGVIAWTFAGRHHYVWDKTRHYTEVKWDDYTVYVAIDAQEGMAFKNGVPVEKQAKNDKLVHKAWTYWCNDSFWLNAVVKCFDPGTTRSIVPQEDGSEALMVTYASGGVTPGDSYLWLLDETGMPKAWKMWVSIIPVGGVAFTWEKWTTLATGAKIATTHKSPVFNIDITNLKAAKTVQELYPTDPFEGLNKLP